MLYYFTFKFLNKSKTKFYVFKLTHQYNEIVFIILSTFCIKKFFWIILMKYKESVNNFLYYDMIDDVKYACAHLDQLIEYIIWQRNDDSTKCCDYLQDIIYEFIWTF